MWTNLVNGKHYVGKGHKRRAWEHLSCARRGKHGAFYNALRKYGESAFELRFLAKDVTHSTALEMEKHAIYVLDSKRSGYNCTFGGEGMGGWRHSEETKNRIRSRLVGRVVSKATRQKQSETTKGVPRPYVTEALWARASAVESLFKEEGGRNLAIFARKHGMAAKGFTKYLRANGWVLTGRTHTARWVAP